MPTNPFNMNPQDSNNKENIIRDLRDSPVIKESYSLVRSNRLVTAVGKGPTIDTAYTSLQLRNTKKHK